MQKDWTAASPALSADPDAEPAPDASKTVRGASKANQRGPELPEIHTQGETLDQARKMVKNAIEFVLDERRARGEAIPPTGWALVESVEIAA